MQLQGSFSQAEYAGKKKRTRRDKFLAEMEAVVPWARLVERLRPFYPKGERGRPPVGLERGHGLTSASSTLACPSRRMWKMVRQRLQQKTNVASHHVSWTTSSPSSPLHSSHA